MLGDAAPLSYRAKRQALTLRLTVSLRNRLPAAGKAWAGMLSLPIRCDVVLVFILGELDRVCYPIR